MAALKEAASTTYLPGWTTTTSPNRHLMSASPTTAWRTPRCHSRSRRTRGAATTRLLMRRPGPCHVARGGSSRRLTRATRDPRRDRRHRGRCQDVYARIAAHARVVADRGSATVQRVFPESAVNLRCGQYRPSTTWRSDLAGRRRLRRTADSPRRRDGPSITRQAQFRTSAATPRGSVSSPAAVAPEYHVVAS